MCHLGHKLSYLKGLAMELRLNQLHYSPPMNTPLSLSCNNLELTGVGTGQGNQMEAVEPEQTNWVWWLVPWSDQMARGENLKLAWFRG